MRRILILGLVLAGSAATANELAFDFGTSPPGQTPAGFHSTVGGLGKPGDWKIVLEQVAPALEPLSSKAPQVSSRAALAQLSGDSTGYHFPLLILENQRYDDFTLKTRLKIMGGEAEQAAGIVFRYQNESNYYALYISSMDHRFRFFKVVGGIFSPQFGPETPVSKGDWHEMAVQCEGNHIHCLLDGKELIPMLTDDSFRSGGVGFWTKSDTVAYFADTRISYQQKEKLAEKMVRAALKEYSRLLGLKIYASPAPGREPVVIASKDPAEIGKPGGATEKDVIARGNRYFSRDRSSMSVTLPLHDRNGDPIAAVCVTLKSFPGQTEENAFVRAQPVIQGMQAQVESLDDLQN